MRRAGPLVAAGILAALSGCRADTGPVRLDQPAPAAAINQTACHRFLDLVPARLADRDQRPVEPAGTMARAWGDPPLTIRCGVERPSELTPISHCVVVDRVGWFVPHEQTRRDDLDSTFTAVGYRPLVELRVPASYGPEVGAAALAELSTAVRTGLRRVPTCR